MDSSSGKSRWPDLLVVLLKILMAMIAITTLCLAFRTTDLVPHWPLTEDGYYAYTVSSNIAEGNGITIDDSTLTNGFQPLFTFLSVPVFKLTGGDKFLAIRYMLFIHWICYIGTAYFLGLIGLRAFRKENIGLSKTIFWLVAFAYLASSLVFRSHYNGLETGFYLLLLALTWLYWQSGRVETFAGMIGFGVLLGFVVLARIDSVFLVIIVSAYLILKHWKKSGFKYSLRYFLVPGLALAISSPWWYFNLTNFGSLMPISGTAQQDWVITFTRLGVAIASWFQITVQPTSTGPYNTISMHIVRIVLALIGIHLIMKLLKTDSAAINADPAARDQYRRTIEFGGIIVVWILTLAVWYVLSSWVIYFYIRYFLPLILVSTLGLGYLLAAIARKRPALIATAALLLSLPLAMLLMLCFSDENIKLSESLKFPLKSVWYHHQLALVEEHVPLDEYVSAVGSGTLGFFRDRVVNLDGKVNRDALEYRDNLWEYLEERDIRWLCDYRYYIEQILGEEPEERGWRRVAEGGGMELFHYEGD